jgi:hypothetical protein
MKPHETEDTEIEFSNFHLSALSASVVKKVTMKAHDVTQRRRDNAKTQRGKSDLCGSAPLRLRVFALSQKRPTLPEQREIMSITSLGPFAVVVIIGVRARVVATQKLKPLSSRAHKEPSIGAETKVTHLLGAGGIEPGRTAELKTHSRSHQVRVPNYSLETVALDGERQERLHLCESFSVLLQIQDPQTARD